MCEYPTHSMGNVPARMNGKLEWSLHTWGSRSLAIYCLIAYFVKHFFIWGAEKVMNCDEILDDLLFFERFNKTFELFKEEGGNYFYSLKLWTRFKQKEIIDLVFLLSFRFAIDLTSTASTKYLLLTIDCLFAVYNDQPISSKSPPTRDKLQPENKAQVRGRSRETDTTGTVDMQLNIFPSSNFLFCFFLPIANV